MAEGTADLSAPDGAQRLAQQVRAVVGATKGAIDTLVKHFAASRGPRGIRVNAVAPGVADTDMSSFVKTRRPELPRHHDVELGVEPASDLRRDHDAPAGQAEHEGIPAR